MEGMAAAVESLGTLSEWLPAELLPSATSWVQVEVINQLPCFFLFQQHWMLGTSKCMKLPVHLVANLRNISIHHLLQIECASFSREIQQMVGIFLGTCSTIVAPFLIAYSREIIRISHLYFTTEYFAIISSISDALISVRQVTTNLGYK